MKRFALVVLMMLVAGCNSGSTTNPSPNPAGATVTIVSGASGLTVTAFSPNPITVSAGTTVQWVNSDATTHNPTANDGTWSTGDLAPSGAGNHTFSIVGTYAYHCSIHPNMVATVTVQ